MKDLWAFGIVIAAIIIIIGWIKNLIWLFGATSELTVELVVRVIGVFSPFIGGVVGWL